MAVGGTLMVGAGAVDVLAGSKLVGAATITGGYALLANSRYPVKEGLQEMDAAWNNDSASLDNSDNPNGLLGDAARQSDCSSACVQSADAVDTIVNVVGGNVASTVSKVAAVTEKIGEVSQRVEEVKEMADDIR